ncbi:hypothetical protein C2S52_005315 [Perilla frutescens var. hirtella]|nr:hypothetical protein C2S52_005315 [Perilla frutescens var. hirtella]
MKMKVNASTTVKPTPTAASTTVKPTPTAAVWISNLDVIMSENFHVPTVYVYRSTGATDFFDTEVLKASLGRALVEFYPLAGRLKKDANGRLEIDCNGEGRCSWRRSATAPSTTSVTCLGCGGVVLGIAVEHHVMDGFSSGHFINTWAEIARGGGITTKTFLDRRVLAVCNPPQPQFPHVEYLPPPTLRNRNDNFGTSETMTFSIFKLTCDQLNALKAKCQGDERNKARGLTEGHETKLHIPVDGQSRLRPPLPRGYFGNVVFKATTVALCGELKKNPLEFAVSKIHEAIVRMDDEYLRSGLDYLEIVMVSACLGFTTWFPASSVSLTSRSNG